MASDVLFKGIFETEATTRIDMFSFLLAVGAALLIGFLLPACTLISHLIQRVF